MVRPAGDMTNPQIRALAGSGIEQVQKTAAG
jgi:hypothetical protein